MKNNNCLFTDIREDYKINSKKSFLILLDYRIKHRIYRQNNVVIYKFGGVITNFIFWIVFFLFNIQAQISYKAQIGSKIKLPHSGQGLVISSKAIIGDEVTIFHQVTIGVNDFYDEENKPIKIGDRCYIASGAKIISCNIGDDCRIGANAVVTKNLPNGSLCYSENVVRKEYYSYK